MPKETLDFGMPKDIFEFCPRGGHVSSTECMVKGLGVVVEILLWLFIWDWEDLSANVRPIRSVKKERVQWEWYSARKRRDF